MALGRESDDETLDSSEVRVWLDMSSECLDCGPARSQSIFHIGFPNRVCFFSRPTDRFDVEQRPTVVVQRLRPGSVEELRPEPETRRHSHSSDYHVLFVVKYRYEKMLTIFFVFFI